MLTAVKDRAPRTKPKDAVRTRAAILQAALEEFARHGFEAATTREIAARIGMSHGIIRYHFKTKEKLWFEAVAFLFERLAREVRLDEDDARKLREGDAGAFRNWLRAYVRYCARHPEHARIMIQESVAPSPRLALALRRHVRRDHLMAKETVAALQENGVLPAGAPAESLIYIVSGACQNLFALAPEVKVTLGYKALTEEAIEAHAETVVALFCPAGAG